MATSDQKSVKEQFEAEVSEALKVLLETKHLYQHLSLNFMETIGKEENEDRRWRLLEAIPGRWHVVRLGHDPQLPPPGMHKPGTYRLTFVAPRVRLYCSVCKRPELHDCSHSDSDDPSFFLVYNCLNCPGRVTFLVERAHSTASVSLKLSGRNPMESVAPSPSVPPFLEGFYSDAVIAFTCGYTRMGIFGLRTVIEQFARAATREVERIDGEKLLDKYAALLPIGFSSLYPSLGSLYKKLSADMHGAVGDPVLFEHARQELDSHFGALRALTSGLDPAIASSLSRKR